MKDNISGIKDRLTEVLKEEEDVTTKTFDFILRQAVHHRASDIHLEPIAGELRIRLRIDGILHDVAGMSLSWQQRLVSHIKVLSNLIVYKKDLPQDGSLDKSLTGLDIDTRVTTFPTIHGEKVVIRLLDSDRHLLEIEELGFSEDVEKRLKELIIRPNGTLLLTGPSGSGKTTTIYTILRRLSSKKGGALNIVTIEDPVEYDLKNISQTQINPSAGMNFASALRSILRQDPEVIMIGEIRDHETARIAIQAGLTGHLVISTIHSPSAVGVFTRLIQIEIEPFLIASSITGILAQRLVRLICQDCREAYQPDEVMLERLNISSTEEIHFYRGKGCDSCGGFGYRGRTAIAELLTVNNTIRDLIMKKTNTPDLEKASVRLGSRTLREDGLEKMKKGLITIEELCRVLT